VHAQYPLPVGGLQLPGGAWTFVDAGVAADDVDRAKRRRGFRREPPHLLASADVHPHADRLSARLTAAVHRLIEPRIQVAENEPCALACETLRHGAPETGGRADDHNRLTFEASRHDQP